MLFLSIVVYLSVAVLAIRSGWRYLDGVENAKRKAGKRINSDDQTFLAFAVVGAGLFWIITIPVLLIYRVLWNKVTRNFVDKLTDAVFPVPAFDA